MTLGAALFASVVIGGIFHRAFLARVKMLEPVWFQSMELPHPLLGAKGFKPNGLSIAGGWRCLKRTGFDQQACVLFVLSCLSEVGGAAFLLCLFRNPNVLSEDLSF